VSGPSTDGPDFGNSVAYPVATRPVHWVALIGGTVMWLAFLVLALEGNLSELPAGSLKELAITGVVLGVIAGGVVFAWGLSGVMKIRRRL
jgi:hypothetical protein